LIVHGTSYFVPHFVPAIDRFRKFRRFRGKGLFVCCLFVGGYGKPEIGTLPTANRIMRTGLGSLGGLGGLGERVDFLSRLFVWDGTNLRIESLPTENCILRTGLGSLGV